MSLPIQLALVPDGVKVDPADLTRVASALSKQVQRDFAPIWGVDATVDPFLKLEDVPSDYWPMVVLPNVQGAAGYHEDKDGQPFAVIQYGQNWSLTASHECLEMLGDPWGRRLRIGDIPQQAASLVPDQKRVRFLVEVCDPSESGQFGYQVNGMLVSDFYTPEFFDPVKVAGLRYSFTGAIDEPRKVLDGGYISWENPLTREWWQLRMFPDEFSSATPHVLNLSKKTVFEKLRATTNLRSAIDRVTLNPPYQTGVGVMMAQTTRARAMASAAAQKSRAQEIRAAIRAVMGPGKIKAESVKTASSTRVMAKRSTVKRSTRKRRG